MTAMPRLQSLTASNGTTAFDPLQSYDLANSLPESRRLRLELGCIDDGTCRRPVDGF